MPCFRLCIIHTWVKFSVQNNAATNAGSHSDANQTILVPPRAPSSFPKSGGIGIVLHRNFHLEQPAKIFNDIAALPSRKEIHVPNFSAKWIHGPPPATPDPRHF